VLMLMPLRLGQGPRVVGVVVEVRPLERAVSSVLNRASSHPE